MWALKQVCVLDLAEEQQEGQCDLTSKELVVGDMAKRARKGPLLTRPERVCFRAWIFF